ncbi:MAG: hypothetical protein GY910_09660 [bacterium]|nr:hypothetical protein [Deltaproteobacteria bacterium]MCP4905236.1 hypothetical protein [bacterium]
MQRPIEMLVENEILAGILIDCDRNPGGSTEANWARCANFYFIHLNGWEYTYYQYRDEAIPVELWRGADDYYEGMVSATPGYARVWEEMSSAFDGPFRSYAEGHVSVNSRYRKAAAVGAAATP